MENPLVLLTPELMGSMLHNGFTHFIRQSYPRGLRDGIKEAFLFTAYKDGEIDKVNAHFQAISHDDRKYQYYVGNKGEKEKLFIAADQPAGYLVYMALLKDR